MAEENSGAWEYGYQIGTIVAERDSPTVFPCATHEVKAWEEEGRGHEAKHTVSGDETDGECS
jgi:hypothetical protein